MTICVSFTVFGEPRGKARAITVRGHSFTPQRTVSAENLIKLRFNEVQPLWCPWPAHTPIKCELKAYFWPSKKLIDRTMKAGMKELKLTKSDLQNVDLCVGLIKYCDDLIESTPMISKPDWDNTGKLVSDALNKICYYDDCAIYDSHVTKWYSRKPRLEIKLEAFI